MSTSDNAGFGKFVPGFDFLQNLAKAAGGTGGSASAMPNMAQWLVPSLKVEDLEKRIEELKHVQFWLDQNARALSATIQALEVQKMTMETLKGMNFTMGMPGAAQAAAGPKPAPAAPAAPPPAPEPEPPAQAHADASKVIDPMQLWGALTQQFQQIASSALQDVAKHSAAVVGSAKAAGKTGATKAKAATAKTAGKAPRKTTPAKRSSKPRRSTL
jgi:hypothetical protein